MQPLFDTHLHYNAGFAGQYPPARIISILRENAVSYAAVTSYPPERVISLYKTCLLYTSDAADDLYTV